MSQEENRRMLASIGQDLKDIANNNTYICTECNERFSINDCEDTHDDDDDDSHICPHCHKNIDINDCEQYSIYDYMNNEVLDYTITINAHNEYRNARLAITLGGPAIYIDTRDGILDLYWWAERETYYLSNEIIQAFDEIMEEIYLSSK